MTQEEALEIGQTMEKKGWVALMNDSGMWAMGIEKPDGLVEVRGMGISIKDAFEMAMRSERVEESK